MLIALAMVASACGGGDDSDSARGDAATDATDSSTAADDAGNDDNITEAPQDPDETWWGDAFDTGSPSADLVALNESSGTTVNNDSLTVTDTTKAASAATDQGWPTTIDGAIADGLAVPQAKEYATDLDVLAMTSILGAAGVSEEEYKSGILLGGGAITQNTWDAIVCDGAAAPCEQTYDLGDGNTITYWHFGNPEGKEVLMLSGIATSKTSWDPAWLEAMSRYFHVTILDMPGVGTATIADLKDFTYRNQAGWAAELVEKGLGLSKVNVLGWAYSGKLAAMITDQNPDLVDRWIDIAGNIYSPKGNTLSDELLGKLTSGKPLQQAWVAWPNNVVGRINMATVGMRVLGHDQETITEEMLTAFADSIREYENGDYQPRQILRSIQRPALVIAGDLDEVALSSDMKASVRVLSRRVPVVYSHYAKASHTVNYQDRPWVMLDIRNFMA